MSTIIITLPKHEKERLNKLAVRYGLSLKELTHRILQELSSEIPEESWNDYTNPKALKSSFRRAVTDYKRGRFSKTL